MDTKLDNALWKRDRSSIRMFDVTIQIIDSWVCIPLEGDPQVGLKHVVGENIHY
jgi:hypothetical protein